MYNETYLQHHGVLGQKWGVRRYQNKDGTRIKKVSNYISSVKKEAEKRMEEEAARPHYNVSAKETKRNMDSMTDAELRAAINRIKMQEEVKHLSRSGVDKGLEAVTRKAARYNAVYSSVAVLSGNVSKIAKLFLAA